MPRCSQGERKEHLSPRSAARDELCTPHAGKADPDARGQGLPPLSLLLYPMPRPEPRPQPGGRPDRTQATRAAVFPRMAAGYPRNLIFASCLWAARMFGMKPHPSTGWQATAWDPDWSHRVRPPAPPGQLSRPLAWPPESLAPGRHPASAWLASGRQLDPQAPRVVMARTYMGQEGTWGGQAAQSRRDQARSGAVRQSHGRV